MPFNEGNEIENINYKKNHNVEKCDLANSIAPKFNEFNRSTHKRKT